MLATARPEVLIDLPAFIINGLPCQYFSAASYKVFLSKKKPAFIYQFYEIVLSYQGLHFLYGLTPGLRGETPINSCSLLLNS
jgi:site-specific DNA-cytosine methylase